MRVLTITITRSSDCDLYRLELRLWAAYLRALLRRMEARE